MNDFLMALPEKGQYYFDKIDESKVNIAYTKKEYNGFINFLRRINVTLIKHGLIPFFNKKLCKKVYDIKIIDAITKDTGLAIIDAYVKNNGGEIVRFVRYAVGEGIEKKEENFAEEVMSQVNA